jgi:hypothetical protein
MPTGYTADIAKDITFEQFALGCARAFGACIMMRDEPADTPIPDRFEPSDYHQRKLEEAHAEIEQINAMSRIELQSAADATYSAEAKTYRDYIQKESDLKVKYEAMLAKAEAWTPPTGEHTGLKDFMIEQITKSISFDCGSTYWHEQLAALKQDSGDEWKAKRLAKLQQELAYHEGEHRKEVERAASRTAWVKALRGSLAA